MKLKIVFRLFKFDEKTNMNIIHETIRLLSNQEKRCKFTARERKFSHSNLFNLILKHKMYWRVSTSQLRDSLYKEFVITHC